MTGYSGINIDMLNMYILFTLPEYHKPKIVHVVTVVLSDVHTIHIHEYVSDHDHGCLVIAPGPIQRLQKVVIQTRQHLGPNLGLQMSCYYFFQPWKKGK